MNTDQKTDSTKEQNVPRSKSNLRQLILVGILLVVLGAFLYDKYVLMPSAEEKINRIIDEVATALNEQNREQVREIAGVNPAKTFEHRGYSIDQYRFPRGLPFYPRPVLDIAFDPDNAIAFLSQTPMTPEYVESKMPKMKIETSEPGERKNLIATPAGG